MLNGIFLNTAEAQCSIYESGKMIYEALKLSQAYQLDYLEISSDNRIISREYDFYAFNYHCSTMSWLNTSCVKLLPGLKLVFVLEILPNDPFVHCPKEDFDVYCVLDPTIKINDKRVYAFPRPLEALEPLIQYQDTEIPIIGSFGFATVGKGFELLVDAVNKEFEQAIIRINVPSSTYADLSYWHLQRKNYAQYIEYLCKQIAKPSIEIQFTRDFMTKQELINWCASNTLNVFFYNRNQPGLSATTDQAIVSGRPLAVSANETFRHILEYLKPYPTQSLKESIALSQPKVLKMREDWSPINFAIRFEEVLKDFEQFFSAKNNDNLTLNTSWELQLILPTQSIKISLFDRLSQKLIKLKNKLKDSFFSRMNLLNTNTQELSQSLIDFEFDYARENTILIVSHKNQQCGVYQYGRNITQTLQKSTRYLFAYAECSSAEELRQAIIQTNPSVIIYNYYPATMPWLNHEITSNFKLPQLGIFHEVTQEEANQAQPTLFDYWLCPDPTIIENNSCIIKTRRLIPSYINTTPIPEVVTIGSFGFGFKDKGFEKIVETVQKEFDHAIIRLHLPFNDIVDPSGKEHALATADRCRKLLFKSGINLNITHDFLNKNQLLDFLAGNTINVFFYDTDKHKGISSCIEYALAVQRPLAITKCGMFRHVSKAEPSIYIEDTTLTQIIENGIAPLVPFYNEWSEIQFILDYEHILDKILGKQAYFSLNTNLLANSPSVNKSYNRILNNEARNFYKHVVENLFDMLPDMMKRKIQEANVQQAFVLDTVKDFTTFFKNPKILCVGSYEDTAAAGLKQLGYVMEEIDPAINYDLNTFFTKPSTIKNSYDIIFSTSVIEHVENDELFISQVVELLAPRGTAILTCDYNDQYQLGDPIPDVDFRFYTQKDFKERFLPLLKDCFWVDEPQWDCPNPDFTYAGIYRYTFATLVFQKKKP